MSSIRKVTSERFTILFFTLSPEIQGVFVFMTHSATFQCPVVTALGMQLWTRVSIPQLTSHTQAAQFSHCLQAKNGFYILKERACSPLL